MTGIRKPCRIEAANRSWGRGNGRHKFGAFSGACEEGLDSIRSLLGAHRG